MYQMLKDGLITRVTNSVVAGTSDQDSTVLDMSGYDGVIFIASLGDVTSTSVLQLLAYENTASSTSSPTPVAVTAGSTTAYTAGATDSDNKLLVVDVHRPSSRYIFARVKRGTANAVIDGVIAIQYRSKSVPVTQSSTVLASALSTPEA